MKREFPRFVLILIINFCCNILFPHSGFSQTTPKQYLNELVTAINVNNDSLAIEKLYLQTDKPAYLAGDTLWFKAYLLNTFLNYSTKSGVLYLELANDSSRLFQRIMLPVYRGMAFGSLHLDDDLPEGGYTLTVYTSWMRNFGEDFIFRKRIYITNSSNADWLISYRPKTLNDKLTMDLKISEFDGQPIGLREMQVNINDGKRTLFKNKTETSQEGLLNLEFELPPKGEIKNMSLGIQDLRKSQGRRKINIPVLLNRPEKTDLQFMPEGGKLIADQKSSVAFKALSESGYGTDVSGKVYDNKGQEIVAFASSHAGIGMFSFIPKKGDSYKARLKISDSTYKEYQLPIVNNTGTSLHVDNPFKKDSCEITISVTGDSLITNQKYYLIGMARNAVCWGALVSLDKGYPFKHKLDKKLFPSGIIRFILIDQNRNPLNERMIYNDLGDKLDISITANKKEYRQRDSISLNVEVKDREGKAVAGSFSLAVTDNGQVRTDSISGNSILSYMLLTSELKGNVEKPGYYDNATMLPDKWSQLDYLLLAQGWKGYDWSEAFKPRKPMAYAAEEQFVIKGRVTNMFNKPVAKSSITLLSKNPLLVLDTLTNENGIFTFKGIFPGDTAAFFISAKNKRGKSFNVGIEVDEFKPPVFSPLVHRISPWYVNIDTITYSYVNNRASLKKEKLHVTGGNMLKEVVVNAKKVVKGSKNLNGAGEADVIIDEAQLEKEGRTTLGELLRKNVKGFGTRFTKKGVPYYSVYTSVLHLVIDGINTESFIQDDDSIYQYLKNIFDYYDAEEIKGIEALVSVRYSGRYVSSFLDPMSIPWDHAFIEVTTRGGNGPFLKKSVGTYLYKPMSFTVPKEFYVPKYAPGSIADMSDIRSTVFWAPNIITDKDGKATVSFFSADNPGSYTLKLEGADLQGHLGTVRSQLIIK